MRIENVSVDVVSRDPPSRSTAPPQYRINERIHYMGLVRIMTTDGVESNAFLGPTDYESVLSLANQVVRLVRGPLLEKNVWERE